MQPRIYASYPFLTHSSEFVKAQDISLEDLLYSAVYERARERAFAKIQQSVQREEGTPLKFSDKGSLEEISTLDYRDKIVNELLSYVIARIIISCINDPFLIQWYAHHQAFLAYNYLGAEDLETLTVVSLDLGVEFEEIDDETVSLDFRDYLTSTKNIKSPDWKLVNRNLDHGRVLLNINNLKRLLMEVVRTRVINEFPRPVTDEIVKHFKDWSNIISNEIAAKKAEFEKFNSEDVDLDLFPPCVQSLIGRIAAGENISHEGRFTIVSFGHTIGMTKEDIFKIFAAAPDFDQSKSQYQVEHIIGEISGTEYTPPECSTMKSYGNCTNPDGLCKRDWLTHPLKYYKNKLKWKKKEEEKLEAIREREEAKEKKEADKKKEEPKVNPLDLSSEDESDESAEDKDEKNLAESKVDENSK